MIDADVASHPTEQLREWKTLAEMRAYLRLRGFAVVDSRSFEQLERKIPDLVAEMRIAIEQNAFTRELIAMSNRWVYGG